MISKIVTYDIRENPIEAVTFAIRVTTGMIETGVLIIQLKSAIRPQALAIPAKHANINRREIRRSMCLQNPQKTTIDCVLSSVAYCFLILNVKMNATRDEIKNPKFVPNNTFT